MATHKYPCIAWEIRGPHPPPSYISGPARFCRDYVTKTRKPMPKPTTDLEPTPNRLQNYTNLKPTKKHNQNHQDFSSDRAFVTQGPKQDTMATASPRQNLLCPNPARFRGRVATASPRQNLLCPSGLVSEGLQNKCF